MITLPDRVATLRYVSLADTERNRAAVHEAGHALVAARRGVRVAAIELHGSDGAGGMRVHEAPAELDRVWILYAGPFAEKVVFGRLTPTVNPPERDELLLAHTLCRTLGIPDTTPIMDGVEEYLRRQRPQLELVASRLLEANTLSGTELDVLLHPAELASPR
jgi:ATP-dependent Zn protease